MEPVIIGKYIQYQENNGHEGITVKDKGLVIDKDNPVLAAGVDGEVSDPKINIIQLDTLRQNTTYSHQS